MENLHLTVGDVAAGSPEAAGILEHYGIDYCCTGKRPFDDACREKGLSPASVAAEIASAAPFRPARARDWNAAPLRELIDHIVSTHHEFLKLELPRTAHLVRRVVEVHGASDPALSQLENVFEALWQELNFHMHKEEMMLFPAIERYVSAARQGRPLPPAPFGSFGNPIAAMEAEHESAGMALRQIRQLTVDYQAPESACPTYCAMLKGLKAIEGDLHIHVHLENNILFPRVIALEQRLAGRHN